MMNNIKTPKEGDIVVLEGNCYKAVKETGCSRCSLYCSTRLCEEIECFPTSEKPYNIVMKRLKEINIEDVKPGMIIRTCNNRIFIVTAVTDDSISAVGVKSSMTYFKPVYLNRDNKAIKEIYPPISMGLNAIEEESVSNDGFLYGITPVIRDIPEYILSLEDIADKFGVPVESLKIKE